MSSSEHQTFCSEPMRGKPVTAIPGIGEVAGAQLQAQGFPKATDVLGKYLTMRENPDDFQGWLKEVCGANATQLEDCYNAMREWCQHNL
ncbi:barrier-to-autointegration factor-like isoform X2 [Engraulis encrasicolus]